VSEKNNENQTTVIVLDDDVDTRFAISRILGKCGCHVLEAESVSEALSAAESHSADAIFSDIRLPGEAGGEELLELVQARKMDVQVVLMSCAMDAEMSTRLMENGATACAQKPFFKDTCEQILDNIRPPRSKAA